MPIISIAFSSEAPTVKIPKGSHGIQEIVEKYNGLSRNSTDFENTQSSAEAPGLALNSQTCPGFCIKHVPTRLKCSRIARRNLKDVQGSLINLERSEGILRIPKGF